MTVTRVVSILDWDAAALAGPDQCGGKGWNLGRLHRYGFPVPVGFVISADSYRRFLLQPALSRLCHQVRGLQARAVSLPEASPLLEQLRREIVAAELDSDLQDDLQQFLAAAGLDQVPVAVRSSATAEDSPEYSFAGIHQSFLNVRGLPGVIDGVKRCYASLWTPQAVAYRRHCGLDDEAVACAIVICAMVTRPGEPAPAAAGVVFTCDPRTGRRDLITISAAPGLGEAVVGGSVNPEEISVRAEVTEMVVASRTGRPDQVLTDEQASQLARLADRIHWALGNGQSPQDVEWAHDGERFWVLQARPATNLPRVTLPGAEGLPVIWSNANLKDAYTGVQTTLSWSFYQAVFRRFLYEPVAMAGPSIPLGMEVVRRFGGRAYFDMTTMQWGMYDIIGMLPEETARGLGGHLPLIPVPSRQPYQGPAGRRRRLCQLRLMFRLMREARALPRRTAEVARRASAEREHPATQPDELLARLMDRVLLTYGYVPHFAAGNVNAMLWTNLLHDTLRKHAGERAPGIAGALLAGGGNVTSAEHGYRLFDLAAAARADQDAIAFLTRVPLNAQGWQGLPPASPFRREFERYLKEFGHRAVYELEYANPRWAEDPAYLLQQVRQILESPKTWTPRKMGLEAQAAGKLALQRLPWYIRPSVRWLARKSQEAAALREAAKSATIDVSYTGRMDILAVGRSMVAAGMLDDTADVFNLSLPDLVAFLRGEWNGDGARTLSADRKAQDAVWRSEEPEDAYILDARGLPAQLPGFVPPAVSGSAPKAADGQVLHGLGVSSGRAAGTARVICHPSEAHRLEDGDVLVAPSTDPGWTPLFLRASAVAMEVGGYLSHGAIVAREYGLPTVVNIPGLLKTVHSGERILVDGDSGTVSLSTAPTQKNV